MGRLMRSAISRAALWSARRRPARAAALASRANSCSSAVPGVNAVNSTTSRSTAPAGGDRPPRRGPPQLPADAAELRYDRFLRQRDERAQRLDTELQQPAMRVGVEREHGEPLGGEELRLPSHGHDDRFSRFGARRGHPGNELSDAPPNAECGMRIAEFQRRVVRLTTPTLTFRIPHSALRIW